MTRTMICESTMKENKKEKQVKVSFDLYSGLRFWSAATHGVGAVLGALSGILLLVLAGMNGADEVEMISLFIFVFSMVSLYLASCLYHCINTGEKGRLFLRQLDHSMIFVLIAGTYTPVCTSILGGTIGWTLLAVIWILAILGVIMTLFWLNAPRTITTMFYVGMGWVALMVVKSLFVVLSPAAFAWMVFGGVVYTIGGVLYALKWPLRNHKSFGSHEIFHIFVLLGSVCFYMMMWTEFLG